MSVLALRETLLNRADTPLLSDLYGRVSDRKTIVHRVDRLPWMKFRPHRCGSITPGRAFLQTY